MALTAAFALLGIVAMIVVGTHLGPRWLVAGDGHYVLAAARSLAFDGDLDLTNQYLVMGDRWGLGRDPSADGWRLPAREIGASVLMIPGLWLHHALGLAPRWEPICACLLAAASLGPCWLGCVRTLDALAKQAPPEGPARARELLAAAAVFGLVVPYYAIASPSYSHAPDAAICAWSCWALVERRGPLLVGVLLACAVLTRLQNLLWLAWPAVEIAQREPEAQIPRADRLRRGLAIAGLAALGLAPQLWLGLAHPGSERGALGWTLSFFDVRDYPADLTRVMVGVHGLLRWTPIASLALLGLALGPWRRTAAPTAVLVAMWLLLASVRDVDGGDAFGARRLAGMVGILALGLWSTWSRVRTASSKRVRQLAWPLAGLLAIGVVHNLARTQRAISGALSLVSPDRAPGHR